jgi:hypothetical protein
VWIEIEQPGIRPHVGAVRGNENRQVADDFDVAGVGVELERLPLLVKAPLAELPEADFLAQPVTCFAQRIRLAVRQRCRPVLPHPAVAAVHHVQCHEQRVIVEPGAGVGAEGFKGGSLSYLLAAEEALGGTSQMGHPEAPHRVVIDPACRKSGDRLQIGIAQPAGVTELAEVDQQFTAGKGRGADVRRVAGSDAAEWQHLPERLAGANQPIDEVIGGRAQITGTVRAGQRGRVKENAVVAGKGIHAGPLA